MLTVLFVVLVVAFCWALVRFLALWGLGIGLLCAAALYLGVITRQDLPAMPTWGATQATMSFWTSDIGRRLATLLHRAEVLPTTRSPGGPARVARLARDAAHDLGARVSR